MSRFLMTATVGMMASAFALADLGPRPGAGKTIPVKNVLKFGNEFPNHTFWAVTVGRNGTNVVTLKADTKQPIPLTMNLTLQATVYAVPNDLAKTFATPKEFLQAAATGKLPAGVVSSPLLVKAEAVLPNDRRLAIERVVVVAGGLKDGVTFTEQDPIRKGPKEDPELPTADARPAPRLLVAGLASALALAFGGLWVFRRGK